MRIGVLGDTHDNLRNVARIVELLNDARVERVIHTGDITSAKTLDALAGLHAPLFGVFGNNDLERASLAGACDRHGFRFAEPPLELHWGGRQLIVVHDPHEHAPDLLHSGDVLIHGHDHSRRIEYQGATLVFNPGECAGHLEGHNAIGTLDLAQLETRILRF